jgi:hypothetical protein
MAPSFSRRGTGFRWMERLLAVAADYRARAEKETDPAAREQLLAVAVYLDMVAERMAKGDDEEPDAP